MSDENGEFSIEDQSGVILTVQSLEKSGYRFPDGGSLVIDTRQQQTLLPRDSSPQNRVVIRAWKEQRLTTRVKEGAVHVLFKPNGEFVSIDFDDNHREREVLPGPPTGDLYVAVLAGPKDEYGKFDWTVKLRAVGGGIQEHNGGDLFPYIAPENGYLPEWSTSGRPMDLTVSDARFYVRSREKPRYSEIHVTFHAGWRDGKALVSVRYRTNLDGAREVYP
jgi:hypothetical protein